MISASMFDALHATAFISILLFVSKALRYRLRDLALQRIDILLDNALKNAREHMDLAQRQARIAWRICTRYNIRLPFEKRRLYCRGCKRFIVPGINARVRIRNKAIRCIKITCLDCGHVYRKILPIRHKNPDQKRR